jgi:hypothetical protein
MSNINSESYESPHSYITTIFHPDNTSITYQIIVNNEINSEIHININNITECRETIDYFQELSRNYNNQISNLNQVTRNLQLMILL